MIKESTYLGKPLLTLLRTEDDRYGFSFGLAKAKLIVENLKAIEAFVSSQEGNQNAQS